MHTLRVEENAKQMVLRGIEVIGVCRKPVPRQSPEPVNTAEVLTEAKGCSSHSEQPFSVVSGADENDPPSNSQTKRSGRVL